jgi:hypothetical protein
MTPISLMPSARNFSIVWSTQRQRRHREHYTVATIENAAGHDGADDGLTEPGGRLCNHAAAAAADLAADVVE